jgi:hypothetical protein
MPVVPRHSLLINGPTSLASPFHNSHSLVSRAIDPGGLYLPDAPSRGFFGSLFQAISSMAVIGSLLNGITIFWSMVHRQHNRNTLHAQNKINLEHWKYHSDEWDYKNELARLRVMIMVAIANPRVFANRFVFEEEQGSELRKVMAGMLKRFNPEYYEKHRDELGDTVEWDVVNIMGDSIAE